MGHLEAKNLVLTKPITEIIVFHILTLTRKERLQNLTVFQIGKRFKKLFTHFG